MRVWAVRLYDRAGAMAGMTVASEAEARDVIGRVRARRPGQR